MDNIRCNAPLVRIANHSREAKVHMKQPSGYALRASPGRGPWWLSSWGAGAGEGETPSPHKPDPGHKQSHDPHSPNRVVFIGNIR